MLPKITLTDVRGRSGELGEGIDSIGDKVEITKITAGIFIGERQSDVWLEIILGNDTDEDIMIASLDIQTSAPVSDFDSGESSHIPRYNSETAPLYYEQDTMPIHLSSTENQNEGWNSMYKKSVKLGEEESYFEKGSIDESVKVFLYTVDSKTFSQRVVTVPVTFDVERHGDTQFNIKNFDTSSENGEPVLLPKDDVDREISKDDEEFDEYVDSISFWVRFRTEDIPTYVGDGTFRFDLETASEFGPVRHTYHYYITPSGGRFNDSLVTPEVDYWSPADSRKMFEQWADEYDVEKAAQTGTGSNRQMIRVLNGVRDEKSVTTRGDYEIFRVKKIDESVGTYLSIVLAIVGTLLIGSFGSSGQAFPATRMIVIFGGIFVVVLLLNLFVKNRIIIYLWLLLRRL